MKNMKVKKLLAISLTGIAILVSVIALGNKQVESASVPVAEETVIPEVKEVENTELVNTENSYYYL